MTTKVRLAKLRNGFQKLRADQAGNVLITFTLALVPIMGFVGTAVGGEGKIFPKS